MEPEKGGWGRLFCWSFQQVQSSPVAIGALLAPHSVHEPS